MRRNVIPFAAFMLSSVSMPAFAQQAIQWDSQAYQKIGNALRNSAVPDADINPVIGVLLNQIKTTGTHDQHDSLIRIRTTATEINSSCAHMVGTITPLHGTGQIDIDINVCNRVIPGGLHIDSGGITGPRLTYAPPPAPAPVQIAQAAQTEQPRPPRHQHPVAQQPVSAPPQPTPTTTASGADLTQMSVADAMARMGGHAPPPEHLATPRTHQPAAPAPAPSAPVAQPAAPAPVAAVAVAVAPPAPAPTVTPSATSASSQPPAPAPAQASGISAADRAKFIADVETNHRVPAEIAETDVDIIAQSAF